MAKTARRIKELVSLKNEGSRKMKLNLKTPFLYSLKAPGPTTVIQYEIKTMYNVQDEASFL